MSRYFNIVITGGTAPGPFSIYYDFVSPSHLATLSPSNTSAIGLSGSTSFIVKVPDWTCQSGYTFVSDTTQPNGIGYCTNGCPAGSTPIGGGLCQACLGGCPPPQPISVSQIILYNEPCQTGQTFDVGVIPTPQNCFCLTIKTGSTYNVWNSTYQYQFCSTGQIVNGKPYYTTTVSSTTYYMKWEISRWVIVNNIEQFMPLPGAPIGSTIITSFNPSPLPLSSWNIYFPYSSPTPFSNIAATSGNCSNPLTLEPILGQQLELENNPIDFNVTQINPSCFGLFDGSIIAKATGGYGSWTYSLDNIVYSNITGIFTNLESGNYTVYAKDLGGNETSSVITLLAPTPVNYQLPIIMNSNIYQLSSIGNMNYFGFDYSLNNSFLPENNYVSFDLVLKLNKTYIEPGTVSFDTSDTYQNLSINNVNQTFVQTDSNAVTPIGTSPCSPAVYAKYAGYDEYTITGLTITKNDIITGTTVFGIDTETSGQYIFPCITQGTVNVTISLKNIQIKTNNNTAICGTITQTTLNVEKSQIANSNT
jgi:hypothetical protein